MTPVVQELDPVPDPVRCCEQLEGLPYRLFLDSAARSARLGRYSFLAADPAALVRSKGEVTEWFDTAGATPRPHAGDALEAVRALLAPHASEPVPGLPPFQGGAAGYLAYDWGRTLERLPTPTYDDLAMPDAVFGVYDWVLAWDHEQRRAWLISTGMPQTSPPARAERARARAGAVLARLSADGTGPGRGMTPGFGEDDASWARRSGPGFDEERAGLPRRSSQRSSERRRAPSYPVPDSASRVPLRSSFTHEDYLQAVARVREYIHAGDIFQANLSQRFEAPLAEPPWALYRRLRARNAAPFAAYMDLPGHVVLSASPERFLRVDRDGRVETRPIKGTRPRGLGPMHDAALGQALTESAKDQAENLMIVDLMRNDLSRVCTAGTVRVPELFALERYATVHHLVSTVVGTLEPGKDALDLLRAAFPGGSITGAPKVRAMEIIAELEPSERGIYCGSIGYWSLTGALDTSIAIRTAVACGPSVYFSAGGGIVADSVPEQEYRETLDKARGIIDVLAPAS